MRHHFLDCQSLPIFGRSPLLQGSLFSVRSQILSDPSSPGMAICFRFFLNRGVLFFHAQIANGSRSWVVFGYFRYVTYPLTTSDLNCFRHPNKTQDTRLASTVCWLNQGNCHYLFSTIVTRTKYLFEGNRTFASVCGVLF